MLRIGIAALAASLLSGCAGSVVGDAIAGPEKLATDDDAYCRSIGAIGPDYTKCRLMMTERRDNKHQRALDRLTYRPPAVQCTTAGGPYSSTTTCY